MSKNSWRTQYRSHEFHRKRASLTLPNLTGLSILRFLNLGMWYSSNLARRRPRGQSRFRTSAAMAEGWAGTVERRPITQIYKST